MTKKLILPIIASLFVFVGCSNNKNNNEAIEENNKTTLTTSYRETTDNNEKIILSGKTSSNTKFTLLGNLLFFPDPNNNEKLSVSDISEGIDNIANNSIIDIFNYSVNSLATDGNYIYFSSISDERGLYRLDYQKKEINKINDDANLEMVYQENKLYYISSKDNKLYSYDIKNKEKKLLSDSSASNIILNNTSIFYKNLNDESKLYCLTTDGSANFKLTNSPVDSFVIYDNKNILFSNSSDNNYIYSLDQSTFETKRILGTSVSNLKQYEDNIYFINNEDPNSLYTLIPSNENNKFEYSNVFPYFVNEYYMTDKYVFIEAASSLDNIKIINYN